MFNRKKHKQEKTQKRCEHERGSFLAAILEGLLVLVDLLTTELAHF